MILRVEDRLSGGAYSDVFRPPNSILVYKVFISAKHSVNIDQGGFSRKEDDERRHNTFQSERAAYELASSHPFLQLHIPRFFQRCIVEDVTEYGESVAECYLLDHCYAVEYVDGADEKLGAIQPKPEHIVRALGEFETLGIHHVSDASVFFPKDAAKFLFIDFAIKAYPPA